MNGPPPIQRPSTHSHPATEYIEPNSETRWLVIAAIVLGTLVLVLLVLLLFLQASPQPGGGIVQNFSRKPSNQRSTQQEPEVESSPSEKPELTKKLPTPKENPSPQSPEKKRVDSGRTSVKKKDSDSDKRAEDTELAGNTPSPAKGKKAGKNTTQSERISNQVLISGITSNPVEFFGVKAETGSVVFVIDKSSSMTTHGRFRQANQELKKSIRSLRPSQTFAIIWFDNFAYSQSPRLLKATKSNITEQISKLSKISPGGGTNPSPAISDALAMKPGAIFLLSDGEVDPQCVNHIKKANKEGIPIHTISFSRTVTYLRQIADDSNGFFRIAR